ncbi:uncharacterized protein [Hemitrygon akajei]|uniref:uncharacterized protein n=1 Tax=Hemitrygon akajei TaxID=2704970 RepID=UPI003BF9A633
MAGLSFSAFVLCLFIPAGLSQYVTIYVEHSRINVPEGGDAFFSVRPSAGVSQGVWHKYKIIAYWFGKNATVTKEYTCRAALFASNGSLLLKSVNSADSGEYRVDMASTSGSWTSAVVTLQVIAKTDGNRTLGSGAIVGILLGLLGMGLIGGVSGWLIARKTGGIQDPPQSQYDTSVNSGRKGTLDTNTVNASGTYENFLRIEQGARDKAEDGSSTYMGLVLENQSVYSDLKR